MSKSQQLVARMLYSFTVLKQLLQNNIKQQYHHQPATAATIITKNNNFGHL